MISPLPNRASLPTAAGTTYMNLSASLGLTPGTTESTITSVMSGSATLSNFYIASNAAPGAGTSWAFTVRVNSVDSAVTCTIADTNTTASDSTHSISYVAGDIVSIKIVTTGSPASTTCGYTIENSGTFHPILTGADTSASNSAASYFALQNGKNVTAATDMGSIISTGGTISSLYIAANVVQGAAKSYKVTLVKNGTDTALTATMTNATAANDTTDSIAVVAGDTCYWRVDPTGTPTAGRIKIGAQFTPTIDGESIQTYGSTANLTNAGANNFMGVAGGAITTSTTENARENWFGTVFDVKKLYVAVDTAPGAVASYAFTIRNNLANTTVTCTVTGLGIVTANDTTHTATTTASAWVGVNAVSAISPTATPCQWGFVTYRAPVTATASSSTLMMMGVG